ncbi:MAG: cbb3-type cytochrome oxidase assembly protein CcoS [Pseudomonadota bacterium]
MDALIFLIPAALFLGALGLAGFLWSLRSGQFEDMEGPAMRAISDDDLVTGEGGDRPDDTADQGNNRP